MMFDVASILLLDTATRNDTDSSDYRVHQSLMLKLLVFETSSNSHSFAWTEPNHLGLYDKQHPR
jgi:hypothetical protein